MKIKADLLRVRTLPRDDAGQKIEPEQQLAQRVFQTESAVSMQGQQKPVGSVPTEIIYESTAGQLAAAMRNPCWSCKRFDKRAWRQLLAHWSNPDSPIDDRNQLNAVRAMLLQVRNTEFFDRHISEDGDLDVEHAVSQLGICQPLSEVRNTPVIVHPLGGCPAEVCGPTQPNGFYTPRDRESERVGSATFDNMMKLAQGKRL